MREDGYTCCKCGLVGREERWSRSGAYTFPTSIDGVYLSIDHIIPRSRGGSDERHNLRVACTTCNTKRGAPIDFDLRRQSAEEHW